jgi:hypothetical protein
VLLVRLRLALILLDLYFSALEIENTGTVTVNLEGRDLSTSGTVQSGTHQLLAIMICQRT